VFQVCNLGLRLVLGQISWGQMSYVRWNLGCQDLWRMQASIRRLFYVNSRAVALAYITILLDRYPAVRVSVPDSVKNVLAG